MEAGSPVPSGTLIPEAVPQTALQHVSTNVPVVAPQDSVDAVLAGLRGRRFDSVGVVAVCDRRVLSGVVIIERLLAAPPDARVADVMDPEPPTVGPSVDQEHAAWRAVQHNLYGLPVVDDRGRFLGLIPPQRLLSVLLEEHEEDMARLGGFMASATSARTASTEGVASRLWHRLPWLLLGLLGALLSAVIVGSFEQQLEQEVLIAFFIPGVVYIADAVGTQTETLVIRGLSVGVGVRRIAAREVLTGILLGLLLAGLSLPLVWLLWGEPDVAVAVSLALLAASSIATVIAMTLPWALQSLGKDPAFGSGPLATVIQDLLSIAIYFLTATVIVA